ncbi:UDP-N-acetylglucosamine 2-epimerase [Oceanibaculum pacificum]|uniref:UDP-N-acetyl glucosamine 2-epimerase n=1 Tax=Oceanibaculum pacificum TaxID=580166 RepID=A0A154WFA9_9PROT|nr:UDP-N-acetylglucosamine 2-epimerase [Oceanibaculum pacificum]KZD12192.1 UDP-N-acetyl glucosamine 2-epimerase [Oceanibaculum pacificum]
MKRVIAVFTGNRAEYGLQYPILKAIQAHPALEYRLLVSGAHLDPNFGRTLNEIAADGFEIHAEVTIDMAADDQAGATAKAIGSGILAISDALARLKPDMLVVYADRFEGFAAVIAGSQMNIPTAHIEGGDITEGGALDDSVRHAMTKLAHLHFTTNQQASNRVLAMGEEAWRVHTVGFPAIDMIAAGNVASPGELTARYALDPARPLVLFTQHAVTTEVAAAAEQIRPSLKALSALAADGVQVIVTYPNNDAGAQAIIAEIDELGRQSVPGIQIHRSLGRYNYHGLLALARDPAWRVCCAGNSSSGIKETPAFGCPTVNIGSRQQGRLRAENVLDAGYDSAAIEAAIRTCLFDAEFRLLCAGCENPYGIGDAGIKVAEVLASVPLDQRLIRKRMMLAGEARDGWHR